MPLVKRERFPDGRGGIVQLERAFRIIILLLSFGSVGTLAAFLVFKQLSTYVPYAPSIALSIAFFSFPFLWDVEIHGKSIGKTMSYMGIRKEGFWRNAVLGVATTVFLIGPLIIIETLAIITLGLEEPGKTAMIVSGLPLYMLIFAFTLAPVAEEIFFRGFMLERVGIIISTLLFMLAHFSYGSLTEFSAAFTAGFIFAVIRRWRKSLIPAIFAHMTFNFINAAVVYWLHVIK